MILTESRTQAPNLARTLSLLALLLAPFLIYLETARSVVEIWDSSETFAHGYVILPITLWLVWRKRAALAQVRPQPFWPAMVLLLACGFGWLLAQLGDVQVVRQYTFAAMIPLSVVAVLGLNVARTIAFPLFYILLAVPFGDVFIDPLIDHTADFTIAALQWTGIPVLREGNNFTIPSGSWSVVEACSGLRYLIASITLGALYAHLSYRSWRRQALFMVVAVLVPIVANWLRAYMIVMIGHLSGMELAVGVDHLIYGWLFFGLVMFLMFWIGSFWREDEDRSAPMASGTDAQAGQLAQSDPADPALTRRIMIASAVAILCMAIWPFYESWLQRANHNPQAAQLSLPASGAWQPAQAFSDWRPAFSAPQLQWGEAYRHEAGQTSDQAALLVLYYRNQQQDSRLITSTNRITASENFTWLVTGSAGRSETVGDRTLGVREYRLRNQNQRLLVWHWYWIDQRFITNDYLGKLLQAKEKLLLQGDDSANVFAYAPFDEDPESARQALRSLLADKLGPLEAGLNGNLRR